MSSLQQQGFSVNMETNFQLDSDSKHLLQMFPEEIWELILENVKDFGSLENLSNSSPFFHERLLSRRTTFLLPKVLELLIKKNEKIVSMPNNIVDVENLEQNEEQDRIWMFPWGLRLLCHAWNNTIEEHFQKANINPSHRLSYFGFGIHDDEVRTLLQLCSKFGRLVKAFKFSPGFRRTSESLTCNYLLLVHFLQHVPNVKTLEIDHDTDDIDPIFPSDNQLAQTIEGNPCTKLEALEELDINGNFPTQICAEIMRRNSHIKKLSLFLKRNLPSSNVDFSMDLPNLKDFYMNIIRDQHFQQLKEFGGNWRLTRFSIDHIGRQTETSFLDIFQIVGDYWSETLQDFTIWLPNYRTDWEMVLALTRNERLKQMKALKNVKIRTLGAISLDFLLMNQKTLENIEIVCLVDNLELNKQTRIYAETMDLQIIKYLGMEKEMERSNIWGLFPKLQCVASFNQIVNRPVE